MAENEEEKEGVKDLYKTESAVGMQFFCEDLWQGVYKDNREKYMSDMFFYIKQLVDETEKKAAARTKEALLQELSDKFHGYLTEIDQDLSVTKICNMIKPKKEEDDEDIFNEDELIIDISKK